MGAPVRGHKERGTHKGVKIGAHKERGKNKGIKRTI